MPVRSIPASVASIDGSARARHSPDKSSSRLPSPRLTSTSVPKCEAPPADFRSLRTGLSSIVAIPSDADGTIRQYRADDQPDPQAGVGEEDSEIHVVENGGDIRELDAIV